MKCIIDGSHVTQRQKANVTLPCLLPSCFDYLNEQIFSESIPWNWNKAFNEPADHTHGPRFVDSVLENSSIDVMLILVLTIWYKPFQSNSNHVGEGRNYSEVFRKMDYYSQSNTHWGKYPHDSILLKWCWWRDTSLPRIFSVCPSEWAMEFVTHFLFCCFLFAAGDTIDRTFIWSFVWRFAQFTGSRDHRCCNYHECNGRFNELFRTFRGTIIKGVLL